jgi:hypothetical protein
LPVLLGLAGCLVLVQVGRSASAPAPSAVPVTAEAAEEEEVPGFNPWPRLFYLFGQTSVQVFNQEDLGMSDAHVVLCEVDAAGRHQRVVPLYDIEGGRLDYLRNDLVYFRYSLLWQRSPWHRKFEGGDPTQPGARTHEFIRRMSFLDAVMTDPSRPRHYQAHLYVRRMHLDVSPARWSEARLVTSIPVEVTRRDLAPYQGSRWPTFSLPPGQAFGGDRLQRTEAAIVEALSTTTGAGVHKRAP